MPIPLDLHEYFVNEESIAVALMFSSQSLSKLQSELIAPLTDGFVADLNATLSEQIFKISMTETESTVEQDGVLDDFGWESVTFNHF
jgi:hypothetical protein